MTRLFWFGCVVGAFYLFLGRYRQTERVIQQQGVVLNALQNKLDKLNYVVTPPMVAEQPVPFDHLPTTDKVPPVPKQPEEIPPSSASAPQQKIEDEEEEDPFSRMIVFNELPPSSVTCFGGNVTQRVCLMRNVCYDPARDNFFIVRKSGTFVFNARGGNDTRLLDGTSLDSHNKFYFDYIERDAAEPALQNVTVHYVPKQTFLLARFHRLNIMHTMHDDFLGLYTMHRSFAHADPSDFTRPFSRDHHLFFLDNYGAEKYDDIYKLLSAHVPQKRTFWKTAQAPLCFAEAVVGNSKALTWYHYGFLTPQGPLDKPTDGLVVRDAADYVMRELKLPGWDLNMVGRTIDKLHRNFLHRLQDGRPRDHHKAFMEEEAVIALFVRTRDRIIVNVGQVEQELRTAYGLPVVQVRMEDMDLREQIMILRKAVVCVGMHGSALILGMFLPPGALIVELFPYRIPADNYTPYRTMARLPGMRLAYKSWTNRHVENTIMHPNRTADFGGIVHLAEDEQHRIMQLGTVPTHLCCKDPVWLFRIYQDTIIHIDELLRVIDEGLTESHDLVVDTKPRYHVAPAGVEQVRCETVKRADAEETYDLRVSWTLPWNGGIADRYGLWVHQVYTELVSNTTDIDLRHCEYAAEYDLWVRPHYRDRLTGDWQLGVYSDKFTCKCMPGTSALREQK